jgi:hypothetical protein
VASLLAQQVLEPPPIIGLLVVVGLAVGVGLFTHRVARITDVFPEIARLRLLGKFLR